MNMKIDTNQQQQAPASAEPELSEHEKEMLEAAKRVSIRGVDQDSPTDEEHKDDQQQQPERPDWLPEKFKSAEDLAKAYAELERKLSAKPADDQQAKPEDQPKDGQEQQPQSLNFEGFFEEFAQAGELSDASYEQMAKAGIPREVVDAYIAGNVALQEQRSQEGYKLVGGQEVYNQMTAWAQANMSERAIAAFNEAVSGSPEQMQLAISGLYAKFQSGVGKMPALLNGSASSSNALSGFGSKAEVVRAMSDSRYETDAAYRKSVMDKLALTDSSVI